MKNRVNTGFTLIELSIVLVIIGLLVGGILTGQNLIRAAGARSEIKQIEGYRQAVNTFRTKYGYYPGDILPAEASAAGFINYMYSNAHGNGNGLIEHSDQSPGDQEEAMLWADLTTAGLISDRIDPQVVIGQASGDLATMHPASKLGGSYVLAVSGGVIDVSANFGNGKGYDGRNYFTLMNSTVTAWNSPAGAYMTPAQSFAIDSKMDDGLPLSGGVISAYWSTYAQYGAGKTFSWSGYNIPNLSSGNNAIPYTGAQAASSTSCYDNNGVAGDVPKYSLGQDGGNNVTCGIAFRW